MNKIKLILFACIFICFSDNKKNHCFESEAIKSFYETSQGRIDGKYKSFYKNGKKRAEGTFENNYRIGTWTVYDSTGRLRMQRKYSDPFTFERLFPKVPDESVITLLNVPQYAIVYNSDSFVSYFYLHERAVLWSKRIWRDILPNDNALLFENNRLFSMLNKNVLNKNIKVYREDEFRNEFSLSNADTLSHKVIGFKILEDCFFDADRLVTESRILGICPVVVNTEKKDTVELYWAYFPQTRKFLAKEKIHENGLPTKIKSLDDLFFYRYFWGQIYKENSMEDWPISKNKKGNEITLEAERIEISLIENEHDIWISLTE